MSLQSDSNEISQWRAINALNDMLIGHQADINRTDENVNSLFSNFERFKRDHGPVAHDQIWKSITELWTAHTDQGNYIESINQRLSAAIVDLGGKVGGGGGLLGGLGTGLGISLPVLAVGGLALFLLTRRGR